MNTDQQFRVAVLIVIVLATTIAVYHRVRAAGGSPAVSRKQEGLLLGVTLRLVGLALMQWTLASLGRNLTDTVETRQHATLITHGPYRRVRHPYYVAAAILILATTLISTNLIIGLPGLLVLLLLAIRNPQEERMLVERFGDAYQDYQTKTGRFIPKPRERRARSTHGS